MDEPPAGPRSSPPPESGACTSDRPVVEPDVEAVPPPVVDDVPPLLADVEPSVAAAPRQPEIRSVYRHALPTRMAHWIVVLCLPILTLSGLQIFNAHPALYWGDRSDRDRPLFALKAASTPTGDLRGVTQVLGFELDTTGVLGASRDDEEGLSARGFPR